MAAVDKDYTYMQAASKYEPARYEVGLYDERWKSLVPH
jgi:hypothetical protein